MSKRLQVVFDEAEYDEVRRAADRAGLTVSAWVRWALRDARAAAAAGSAGPEGTEGTEAAAVREAPPGYEGEPADGPPLHIPSLPPGLHRKLRERARRERRTVAGEAAYLLERALADAESLSLLELEGLGAGLWQGEEAGEHVARERDGWD